MQIGETIYLDYHASTPVDERVLRAMHHASTTLFANPHAANHALGWKAAAAIEKAAAKVGNLFGLQQDDMIFTSGASEANAMAFRAAEAIRDASGRAEILIGAADHSSVLNEAARSSLLVRHISLDHRGAPDPDHLKALLNDGTALVSVVGVNNENGAIADLEAIAGLCRATGALLHVDLSQAPLAMDLDLLNLEIDLATVSAHKLYGPKGVGALLMGPGIAAAVRPIIFGAGQQGGMRGGTMPTELIVGFGEACQILADSGRAEREAVQGLRDRFVQFLEKRSVAYLVGGLEGRHPGNALIRFPGCDAADLLARLQPWIAASSQSACSSGSIGPSHVLQAMGKADSYAAECIRFSLGRFSTEAQVDAVVKILTKELSVES